MILISLTRYTISYKRITLLGQKLKQVNTYSRHFMHYFTMYGFRNPIKFPCIQQLIKIPQLNFQPNSKVYVSTLCVNNASFTKSGHNFIEAIPLSLTGKSQ